MEAYLPLIFSAVGGVILGPLVSKVFKGGTAGGVIGGIIGGIGAHFGLDAAGVSSSLLGNSALMVYVQNFLEGGLGGGVLGSLLGLLLRSR